MKIRKRILAASISSLLVAACADRDVGSDEQCYEENPAPGAMAGPHQLVCGEPFGYLPEDMPEGTDADAGPYHVFTCGPRSEGYCELCPAENLNEIVRQHLIEVMSTMDRCSPPEVQHVLPACVTVGDDSCCIHAWYWGSCNVKG
jgi:hypothetical protein